MPSFPLESFLLPHGREPGNRPPEPRSTRREPLTRFRGTNRADRGITDRAGAHKAAETTSREGGGTCTLPAEPNRTALRGMDIRGAVTGGPGGKTDGENGHDDRKRATNPPAGRACHPPEHGPPTGSTSPRRADGAWSTGSVRLRGVARKLGRFVSLVAVFGRTEIGGRGAEVGWHGVARGDAPPVWEACAAVERVSLSRNPSKG
jgi:hypothetical protein